LTKSIGGTSDTYSHLSDYELLQLNKALVEEMYEASEKSLYSFFINFWNTFDPSVLVSNWHLECLCEHAEAAANREIRRLTVTIPPRMSKSTVHSMCLPAWQLLRQPDEEFWLMSHTLDLCIQNIRYTRRIFDHPLYKDRWLDVNSPNYRFSLASDQNTKTRIDTSKGGGIKSGAPRSSVLGKGYTIAVLDDMLDSQDWNNPAGIQEVNDWYSQTFMNRSNDNNNDVVINVQQRLAASDLHSYVMDSYKEQGWFHLNLPARYDSKKTFFSPIGFNDKRSKERELLDGVRLSDSFLIEQEKNPIIYQTRYQQDPDLSNDTNFFLADYWQTTPFKNISREQQVIVWDLSFTDSPKSTYTVGLVMELYQDNYYVVDMYRKLADPTMQVEAVERMYRKYPYAITAIELKANGHSVVNTLETRVPKILKLEPRHYGGSKSQRFGSIMHLCKSKKVWFYAPNMIDSKLEPDYYVEDIQKELTGFPLFQHNDIVDCFSYGLQVLQQFSGDNTLMVTGGEQMKVSDADWDRKPTIYDVSQDHMLDVYVDALSSRQDILDMQW